MKSLLLAGSAVLSASAALAGNLDRSGQGIGALFEEGNWAEFSLGVLSGDVSGTDLLGGNTGDVAATYTLPAFAIKSDYSDTVSWAVIYDQPYGAATDYGSGSTLLGGTHAAASSHALTGLVRYKFSDRFSLHGGLRMQSIAADVDLAGGAYGGLNGYTVVFASDSGFGYVAGGAYEIPEIALRVALTYSSKIAHDLATTENFFPIPGNSTEITTPQSVNIDFRTGIMENTLLFGSIRWVEWSAFDVTPTGLDELAGAGSLVEYDDDVTTYVIGVGRRFTDQWSGAVQIGYEAETDPLVSPLGPTNGYTSVGGGMTYTMDNGSEITAGVRYYWIGDAQAEIGTPDTAVADFSGNTAIAAGIKYGIRF
jgi:long-chain fatty acid transport protein